MAVLHQTVRTLWALAAAILITGLAAKLFCVRCRVMMEGIVPFGPTGYGVHQIVRRNKVLIARARVRTSCAMLQSMLCITVHSLCMQSPAVNVGQHH